jgi:hypothetical protein
VAGANRVVDEHKKAKLLAFSPRELTKRITKGRPAIIGAAENLVLCAHGHTFVVTTIHSLYLERFFNGLLGVILVCALNA